MFILIIRRGKMEPQAYAPFNSRKEAQAFADKELPGYDYMAEDNGYVIVRAYDPD